MSRRRFIALGGAAALAAGARGALARDYPSHTVRLVVGYAAGGATDITARLIAQSLTDRLGQQFIVENRPGAASNLATEQVIRSAPDGHTLLIASAANAINATLYDKLNFDFVAEMVPVAGLARMQNVLVVHPSVPVRTVAELTAYAKANPDRLIAGSPGIGSPGHVSAELFKMMTDVRMVHVPYRGAAPSVSDLLGGQIHLLFDNMATSIEHIRSGKLRALGVTTSFRSPLIPELPTIAETVPGYEASSWFGVTVPKGTPADVVETLNGSINAGLTDRALVERLIALGGAPLTGSAAEFGRLIEAETDKWGKVVRFANLKAT